MGRGKLLLSDVGLLVAFVFATQTLGLACLTDQQYPQYVKFTINNSFCAALQKQQASTSLRLPNDFISQHCPEILQNGEKYQFAVQVVLLPPYASDSTPDTPAQQVLDQQGAFVKRVEETSMGSLPKTTSRTCVYGLKKVLPSHVLQEKWWCRGEFVLQMCCSVVSGSCAGMNELG